VAGSDSSTAGTAAPLERLTVAGLMRCPTTTVETRAHLAAAAYLMKRSNDSALVVTADDGTGQHPLAVITDADVSQAVADGRDLEDTRIDELDLPDLVAVPPDTSVAAAAERMLEMALQHLPVVRDERARTEAATVCRRFGGQTCTDHGSQQTPTFDPNQPTEGG
jgi:CBS domain-containing protein